MVGNGMEYNHSRHKPCHTFYIRSSGGDGCLSKNNAVYLMNVPFLNSLKASSSSSRLFITMDLQTIGSFRGGADNKGKRCAFRSAFTSPVRPYLLQEREQNIIWHNPFPQIAVSTGKSASLPANREIGFHHRVLSNIT